MKLAELKKEIGRYLYLPDDGVLEIVLATIISARLRLGQPVWLVLVGVSSGGKSQLIRPLADEKFVWRVDDLTENTLISGMKSEQTSLLLRLGNAGVLAFSDLTALFSKSQEARDAILGQLRLVYDGEMTKFFGNQPPVTWKGTLGVLAGSTPSIYRHFEQVADMGERFIYYRLRTTDPAKATERALNNPLYGKKLDERLAELLTDYQQSVVAANEQNLPLPEATRKRILEIALFAAQMRTPVHFDYKTGEVDRLPFSEMPMRVALQFSVLARGLVAMNRQEGSPELTAKQYEEIEWCAYSLANEERRAILRTLASYEWGEMPSTQQIADEIGLATDIIKRHAQAMSAIGLLKREAKDNKLRWGIATEKHYNLIAKLERTDKNKKVEEDDGFGDY